MTNERAGFSQPSADADRQALSERLKEAREYVGLKQDDVAKKLGIPRSALSNIEAGSRKVDAIELAQLAKLYQRPVAWFTGEDPSRATDKTLEEVAHVARAAASLSQQDRQELARFADFLKSRARTKAGSDGR
ncbi:helix-turn-helix domain-containing protein [Bradyrhizobium sp.]|jgi:transcriptional regulator with XRE-family HTH domain|uniref:helix-turn-helix domain-containing protein n=1 Tax=Bradyrhizobium sp. TaxID=376 RepID=UPI003C1507E6